MTRPHPPRAAARWRFAAVLLVPAGLAAAAIGAAAGAPPWQAWLPFAAIHGLVPLLDAAVGDDRGHAQPGAPHPFNVAITFACLPAWGLALAVSLAASVGLDGWAWWGLAISAGATGGIVAINVAHELIHRPRRVDRLAGGLLLASVGYGAFKVEHVRGHHLRVATPDDPASARRGESVWRFVPRSVAGTLAHAWRLEAMRTAAEHPRAGRLQRLARNETARWALVSGALATAAAALWGSGAAGFLAVAAAVAIFELEVVNYVEHYGLARDRGPDGRYEPVDHRHSWNVDTAVVNAFLLNLQRHSDHHAHGGRPYTALRSDPRAPRLPAGYGAMVLLALVPPAWRAVIHPRLDRYAAVDDRPV